MITNSSGTATFFFARTLLDDGALGEPEQFVMVPGQPVMPLVDYHCWLTAQQLKTHPGRVSVHVH